MLFYRVEKNERGPFDGEWDEHGERDLFAATFNNNTFSTPSHPTPGNDDGALGIYWCTLTYHDQRGYLFGCSSIDQVKHWFNEIGRYLLKKNGFILCIYETTARIDSSHQSMVHRDALELVDLMDLTEI